MKKFLLIVCVFLLSGCVTTRSRMERAKIEKSFLNPEWRQEIVENNPDLTEKEKETILKGKIPSGIEKEKVEKILGSPYGKYVPDNKMMEVWFYDDFFVGFDKDGKVVKFGIFQQEEENQKKEGIK